MGIILESSILIAAERGGEGVGQILKRVRAAHGEAEAGLSAVTLVELISATRTIVPFNKRLLIMGAVALLATVPTLPQNAELQEKLAAVKAVAAENKQKLHQYLWIETCTDRC
jgi:hypothetical protein